MDANIDKKRLITREMVEARELLKELQTEINPSSFSGHDLMTNILCSVETFLAMLNRVNVETKSTPESPLGHVRNGSSVSECNSDSRKRYRKPAVRWTEQVRVSAQTGLQGPVDDGYAWRKYGQKNILEAKHHRSYYRCSYGKTQGCLARKQVQRSELDWSIFDVTYIGKHSCIETPELLSMRYSHNKHQHDQRRHHNYLKERKEDKLLEETYIKFQASSVRSEKGNDKQLKYYPSFCICSTTSLQPHIGNCLEASQNHLVSTSSKTESNSPRPTASESNYKIHNVVGYNTGEDSLQATADSRDSKDHHMIISPTVSGTSSVINNCSNHMDSSWDWDFPIDYSPPHF
ncbi:probable WRKY transcription factor 41 [Papaver somniferum]|uniref:probable WRKY transcription factor 41 n=1 Tax=Papaver somniferum TaxID=3469 RepID=UPI000E7000BC|nr:probable WRKY transcription factor 41 [Papaver somniferum]